MDFDRSCLAPVFAALGIAASYRPPGGGAPVACRVRPVSAGRTAGIGGTEVWIAGAVFDVRAAEIPAPMAGGVLTLDAVPYEVTRDPYHPERDASGLIWRLDCAWGSPVTFSPRAAATAAMAAAVAAGGTSVDLDAVDGAAVLGAGDRLTISPGSCAYAVTGGPYAVAAGAVAAVAISPALAIPAPAGALVRIVRTAASHATRAGIGAYAAAKADGSVIVATDLHLLFLAGVLAAAGIAGGPRPGDRVTVAGQAREIIAVRAVFDAAGAAAAWECQAR